MREEIHARKERNYAVQVGMWESPNKALVHFLYKAGFMAKSQLP